MSFAEQNKTKLIKMYTKDMMSTHQIAEVYKTYPNKIIRALKSLDITLRDKSSAQSVAIAQGRIDHPTEGKERPQETKNKISDAMYDQWQNMSDEERQRRSDMAKDQWDNMTDEAKKDFFKKASIAVRKASKEGSKMEIYLQKALTTAGFDVFSHIKNLPNVNLELDMAIPSLKTVIEIDGPSHFEPIWGEEAFKKQKKSDREKAGHILSAGYCMIRVASRVKNISEKHKRDTAELIIEELLRIKKKFPNKNDRFIEIETQ